MEVLILLILSIFPIVSIFGISVPVIIILFPFILFNKKIKINKSFLSITTLSFSAILAISILNYILIKTGYEFNDLLYFSLIIFNFLVYLILDNLNIDIKKLIKMLKIFMIIQLAFSLMQRFNLFNTNEIFEELYFHWQFLNAQKENLYLEVSYRSFGTLGSPIYLSIISYITGSIIYYVDGKKTYYYLAFVLCLLAGARTAILIFSLLEFKDIIIGIINGKKNAFKNLILIILMLVIAYIYLPFFQSFVNDLFQESISDDYSFVYRSQMFDLLLNNENVAFGGNSIAVLPSYVDSEYILRYLQFGIVGLICFMAPTFVMFSKLFKNSKNKIIIINIALFLLGAMITSVVVSNLLIAQFIALFIIIIFREEYKNENSNANN